MSKNSFYFSHDNNARNDEKILAVRMELGAEGYGIYFMLLEKLIETENYILIKDYNRIAFDLRVSSDKIKKVIECFGLFAFTEDGKCFYSESLLLRMKPLDNLRKQRIEAGKKSAEKRQRVREGMPSLQKNSTVVQRSLAKNSTEKVKESKEKEINKEKLPDGNVQKKSFKQLSVNEFYESLKPFVKEHGKEMIREFFDYWTEPSATGISRFKLQATWDTAKRIKTWAKNNKTFNKNSLKEESSAKRKIYEL